VPPRGFGAFPPYVPVAERRRLAAQKIKTLTRTRAKEGGTLAPVVITGRDIASTFWGQAWCQNLLSYSDFASRLPRGRSYVRNGAVVDLKIAPGEVKAVVSGSELYDVAISIAGVAGPRWAAIRKDCTGAIASLLELLQGRLSTAVMERLCRQRAGLFPAPTEIELSCSCPDQAEMCKHVAAVLYGVGARLDQAPELLFVLRKVEAQQLLAGAEAGLQMDPGKASKRRIVETDGLGELFGLDMAPLPPTDVKARAKKPRTRR
jgi:uncharacterized Zn finger protein